ncbi:MAG: hypothetical protein QXU87_09370 [Candidatus Caldarchaeum sp.]
MRLASTGGRLSSDRLIGSVSELLKKSPKPKTEEEVILAVRNIICEDSRNVRIRQIASDLARAFSITNNFPSLPPIGIRKLYELPQFVNEGAASFVQHCNGIAIYIAKWANSVVEYLNEADDVFQNSLQTLEITRAGDCDDYTILVCSLLRSIGYEVSFGIMPGHMFPAVILARTYEVDVSEIREKLVRQGLKQVASKLPDEGSVYHKRMVTVPLDKPLTEEILTVPITAPAGEPIGSVRIELSDLLSGQFQDKVMEVNNVIRSSGQGLTDELRRHLETSLTTLSKLLMAYKNAKTTLVQCDSYIRIESSALYDIFQEEVSRILHSQEV